MQRFIAFFDDPIDRETGRARWKSNSTFILAVMGYCIGLGNFWRFPYLAFKWGGALFFVPYLFSLLFFGLPMLMLEIALGQKF